MKTLYCFMVHSDRFRISKKQNNQLTIECHNSVHIFLCAFFIPSRLDSVRFSCCSDEIHENLKGSPHGWVIQEGGLSISYSLTTAGLSPVWPHGRQIIVCLQVVRGFAITNMVCHFTRFAQFTTSEIILKGHKPKAENKTKQQKGLKPVCLIL